MVLTDAWPSYKFLHFISQLPTPGFLVELLLNVRYIVTNSCFLNQSIFTANFTAAGSDEKKK